MREGEQTIQNVRKRLSGESTNISSFSTKFRAPPPDEVPPNDEDIVVIGWLW